MIAALLDTMPHATKPDAPPARRISDHHAKRRLCKMAVKILALLYAVAVVALLRRAGGYQ